MQLKETVQRGPVSPGDIYPSTEPAHISEHMCNYMSVCENEQTGQAEPRRPQA